MYLKFFSKLLIVAIFFDRYEFHPSIIRQLDGRPLDVSYGSPAYKFCECGRRNKLVIGDVRIVGGAKIMENEYPWMALITTEKMKLVCGGSLINDRYVVTAAHCLALGYEQREMKVVLGEFDRCSADTETVTFSIDKLIVHPRYDNRTEFADIMLVRLNMRVTYNEFVRPICLPEIESRLSTARKFENKFVTALGWGLADLPHKVCTLRAVNLEIFKPGKCTGHVATVICAGLNGGGHDTCQGDSGGPLQIINLRNRYELIGVTSSGIGCGDGYPGLYTDVVAMVPWIMQITNRDSMYCWR